MDKNSERTPVGYTFCGVVDEGIARNLNDSEYIKLQPAYSIKGTMMPMNFIAVYKKDKDSSEDYEKFVRGI